SAPQAAHRYTPGRCSSQYAPVNARSVPFSRSTRYCSGVRRCRHSSSVLITSELIRSSSGGSLPAIGSNTGPAPVVPEPVVPVLERPLTCYAPSYGRSDPPREGSLPQFLLLDGSAAREERPRRIVRGRGGRRRS